MKPVKSKKKTEIKPAEQKPEEKREIGPPPIPVHEVLLKILSKKDAEAVEKYVAAVVGKFRGYIKSIAIWGSRKTKVKTRKTSDIDIAIVVDDTDVRRMTRAELKDKLFQRLLEMAHPISKKIHPQPYLLTEFWQYIIDGNPVLYNVLRDGVLIYDTGFFLPMQMLMKMGFIKPSKECIDKHMFVSQELLKLVDHTILTKLTYDLEQAVVSSAQSVLMELGYRPPVPNEVAKFVGDFLVKEHKLVDEKYAKIAEHVIKTYKDIEHKEKKEISGEELEKLKKEAKEFVKKMQELLKKIRKEKILCEKDNREIRRRY